MGDRAKGSGGVVFNKFDLDVVKLDIVQDSIKAFLGPLGHVCWDADWKLLLRYAVWS